MRLQYFLFGIISLMTVAVLSSCSAFEDPSKRATANAEDTAIAATLSVVEFQNETMVALRQTADAGVILSNQMTQSASNPIAANPNNASNSNTGKSPETTPQPTAFGGGNVGGNLPTSIPSPAPTTSPATAIYSQATIADELDDAFCALNNNNQFDLATVDTVYFVVYVQQLKPGVNFGLRVENLSGGLAAQDSEFWTSDTTYDSTCIYYGIDAETMGGSFKAGSYKAILQANGANISTAQAEFYINDSME